MSDVIIIGGGPAGSAMGCYLSMLGIDNIILESSIHPRPHVGESMVTSSTRIFKEIGFLETMEREGFVRKYGAGWHAPNNRGRFDIRFVEIDQPGVDQPYTYHVDRSKFDLLLLKHAERLGSRVYQGMHVKQVLFEDGYARGVRVALDNQEIDLPARMVVDASGRNTLLGRQLRLKKKDPIFNQYAIHAWFEGIDRSDPVSGDYIHIYFLPVERGWVWQIPITNTITSAGVVVEKNVFAKAHADLETFFLAQLQTNENLAHATRNIRRINEFKTEGDYSYSMSQFAGNGYVLVGDAARFVDPIFSSGVSVALHSAKFASEVVRTAFERNDFSSETFQPYEVRLRDGVNIWYEFIRLYYKLLPMFTYFIRSEEYRLQIIELLQGEVFDRGEVPVLQAMRDFIATVESTDGHGFRDKLSNIPIDPIPGSSD